MVAIILTILTIVLVICLVLVAAMRPSVSSLSQFELKRRVKLGQAEARQVAREDKVAGDIDSLLRAVEALVLVILVLVLIAIYGWLAGIIVALVVAIGYGALARTHFMAHQAAKLYAWKKAALVNMVYQSPVLFRLIRRESPFDQPRHNQIQSREELQHMVEQVQGSLSEDEKQLVGHALTFTHRQVSDAMTPRKAIDSVKASEFLGPLVLDELHTLGHSHLPVIKGDIDHVIGILPVDELLGLGDKRSVTAEKAMVTKVSYVQQRDSLQQALAVFLQSHQSLAIVTDDNQKTVGLLTLSDVIAALLG